MSESSPVHDQPPAARVDSQSPIPERNVKVPDNAVFVTDTVTGNLVTVTREQVASATTVLVPDIVTGQMVSVNKNHVDSANVTPGVNSPLTNINTDRRSFVGGLLGAVARMTKPQQIATGAASAATGAYAVAEGKELAELGKDVIQSASEGINNALNSPSTQESPTQTVAQEITPAAEGEEIYMPWRDNILYQDEIQNAEPLEEGENPKRGWTVEGSGVTLTADRLFYYLKDQKARYDNEGRPADQRPTDHKFQLVVIGQPTSPHITIAGDYVSDYSNDAAVFKDGEKFSSARLETLPNENMEAYLMVSKKFPDGTIVPEAPEIINFPYQSYEGDGYIIESPGPLEQSQITRVQDIAAATAQFLGLDNNMQINPKVYESHSPVRVTSIPEQLRRLAGEAPIIPGFIDNADSPINRPGITDKEGYREIIDRYEVYRGVYKTILSNNPLFDNGPRSLMDTFNDAFKEYRSDTRAAIRSELEESGVPSEKATEAAEKKLPQDALFKGHNILSYLPSEYHDMYNFGDPVNDSEVFWAMTLAVWDTHGSEFARQMDGDSYQQLPQEKKVALTQQLERAEGIRESMRAVLDNINPDPMVQHPFVRQIEKAFAPATELTPATPTA